MSLSHNLKHILPRRITPPSIRPQCVKPALSLALSSSRPSFRIASPVVAGKSRSFFSLTDVAKLLPNQGDSNGGNPNEQVFHARKILPYTQNELYSLVADVPSYASFIPFCSTSSIISSNSSPSAPQYESSNPSYVPDQEAYKQDLRALVQGGLGFDVRAELEVGFGAFQERFVSRVEGRPGEMVKATVDDSPLFHNLKTTWSFQPASASSPHPTSNPMTSPSSASPAKPSSNDPSLPHPTSPKDHNASPTLLTIDLSFTFANPLHRIAAQAFLPKVSDLMVEAFEKRCLQVYGKGRA